MTVKTFKRYEIKYFVTPSQFETLKEKFKEHMQLDGYCKKTGSYMIYNLYFDTENDDIIRRSLDKPYYKEKLRMRSYTMPTSGKDTVFLEIKKKIGGIVAKRRAIMEYAQARAFMENGIMPELKSYEDRQVMDEIAQFLRRYRAKPKVFISYERTAFFDKEDPELRLSFDKNILARRECVSFSDGDYGNEIIEDDRILMEIKCDGHMPLWLTQLLSEMKLYKSNFSKYGTEYKKYQLSHFNNKKIA